ncbi:MAG: hypothetical protein Q8K63_08605 [Acidimicrobiales bacterium]|nr:hypothetical protein [Acidimicrobiales bacterium]
MERFDELVTAQLGLLTTAQGVELFKRGPFERRVKDGEFIRKVNGLYRVAGCPETPEQELLGATMVYRGVAGFRAAARLQNFDRYRTLRLEIIVPDGVTTRRKDGRDITIHHSTFLPPSHIEVVGCIATTTAARTAFDLSSLLGLWSYAKLVDDGVRRDLLTYEGLQQCRNELRARGRRRSTVVDEFLEMRGFGYSPGDSDPERDLGDWLTEDIGPPVGQHPVVIKGKRRLLDWAYPEYKVAAEYLGLDPHGMPVRVIDDSDRTTELQLAGWFVALITKATGRTEAVRQVRQALLERGWTPG